MSQVLSLPTKYAILRGAGQHDNIIFDILHPNNRDNCFQPYWLLKNEMLEYGVLLCTADTLANNKASFAIHMDVQPVIDDVPCYLFLWETPQVFPPNGAIFNLKRYRKVFTWNDDLVDGKQFIKINFPNPLQVPVVDGFAERNQFCCLIAGNKTLSINDTRNLYLERLKAIRWFEHHAPNDFYLYGVDWDIPVVVSGKLGKIQRRLMRALKKIIQFRPFPSYRGRVGHKSEVLQRTRFSICYENVSDLPGYITEKIFDSFFSGCVPVYWGASNINNYIPADCFIDRREFSDTADVYQYLKAMDEDIFRGYQQRIATFLSSGGARPYSSEAFAETVVQAIVQDLGLS